MKLLENPAAGARIKAASWGKLQAKRETYGKLLTRDRIGELDISNPRTGPVFWLTRPILPKEHRFGKMKGIYFIPLFTFTAKMSCASFSTAAGPTVNKGTCLVAGYSRDEFVKRGKSLERRGDFMDARTLEAKGKRITGEKASVPASQIVGTYICDNCYAGKGSYEMFKLVQLYQVARRIWVEKALERGSFASEMTGALRALLSNDSLMRGQLAATSFFRIHDSGDFWRPDYLAGWFMVCAGLRDVKFWCPIRVYLVDAFKRVIDQGVPTNLSLRPSALIYGSRAPMVGGMAAGSTSAPYPMAGANPPHWDCPAYQSLSGSCAESGCRVCWTEPTYLVNYLTH